MPVLALVVDGRSRLVVIERLVHRRTADQAGRACTDERAGAEAAPASLLLMVVRGRLPARLDRPGHASLRGPLPVPGSRSVMSR
ncbi:hypothetical protein [Streptomyces sp. NPDC096105]|uniref:hypothetical protein n=1 Tax=Streptomyces sp. NPDC096105 TaxID=3366074 RepID=UPI0037FB6EA3